MMVVGFALTAAGMLLLYWMYVGGTGGQPANTSGAPSGFAPGAGAGGGGGGGGGGVW